MAQYPNSRLHEIKYNRVCLSISQLKNIFKIFNKDFNDIFVDLCEKQLEYKEGMSLDFYDVFNLIYIVLNSINSNKKIIKRDLGISLFIQKKMKGSLRVKKAQNLKKILIL